MKNKIILAYYISVGNMDDSNVQEYIKTLSKNLKEKDFVQYFIPVRDEENVRIECVYPKYVAREGEEEEFESVIKRLDEYTKKIIEDIKIEKDEQ